jgi:polar amino acid transport system substrate-binding protein
MLFNVGTRRTALTWSAAVAASSLLLAACGGTSPSPSTGGTPTQSSQAASTPVTIGVDPTTMPYGGKKDGQLIGMDYDVAQVLAKQANLKADIQELTFDNAVPALKSGRDDVSFVGGWYDTPERRAEMNIITYYTAAIGFVTNGSGQQVGATWEGRCGLTLATYASSPAYLKILKDDSDNCTKAGKTAITVRTYAGLAQGVLAVRSGRIAGFLDAVPAVAYQAHVNTGLSFVTASDQAEVSWGIAVSKTETALAEKLAKAVDAARASGELSKVWAKYGLPNSMNLKVVTLNGNPV